MTLDPYTHIKNYLSTTKSLQVAEPWLSEFLANQRPTNAPISALTQTALFRLLASDFTKSLSIPPSGAAGLFPENILDPSIKERRLSGPVPVQVLDIHDIGSSIWSQVEAIERVERGEQIRGREVIRTVTREVDGNTSAENDAAGGNSNRGEAENANSAQKNSTGPHRLLLQDVRGKRAIAIELRPVKGIAIDEMAIGAKLLIKNAIVGRGVIMLEPGCVTVHGGKIEAFEKEWKAKRKQRLLEMMGQTPAEEVAS